MDLARQRICVFGAGGVGGYLAARLALAGRDVSIIARGEHLSAIRTNGLVVESGSERLTVTLPASNSLTDLPPQDVVIVTTKVTALASVAKEIGLHVSPNTAVIFAMNGVFWFYADGVPGVAQIDRLDPGGVLDRHIGVDRSFGMIVRSQNEVVAPGRIVNNGGGRYQLGPALSDPRAPTLGRLLTVPGADVAAADDLRAQMWAKLIRNIAIALVCVPTLSTPGAAFADPSTRAVGLAVMQEAARVAAAHGFADVLDLEADADSVAAMTVVKPSIVQDLERGRAMEIDAQVLAVQDFARAAGVATPTIDALAPLVVLRARLAGAYV